MANEITGEDHWQLVVETIELEHKHQFIHSHSIEETERYGLGDTLLSHFHNADPHIHTMILTPTENGYEITHPPLVP